MRAKKISPLLIGLIRTALRSCEGIRFHPGTHCTFCGGTLSGYDEHKKRFAVLLEDDVPLPLHVIIQRSYCHDCGKVIVPTEPFYPGTRIGSPVVDLCRSFSTSMPCSRASALLGRIGVVVDRWSARHYYHMQLPEVPVFEVFSLPIPASIIALSSFPRPGSEPLNPEMEDVIRACNYPFIPFRNGSLCYESAVAVKTPEQQQKILDGIVNGFSRSLGVVFICFWILMNIGAGLEFFFPPEIIDLTGLDLELLSINGLGSL